MTFLAGLALGFAVGVGAILTLGVCGFLYLIMWLAKS